MNDSIVQKPRPIPKPFAEIVDRVNQRDREFFDANPDEPCYLRPHVPGEYPPASLAAIGVDLPGQDCWVLVTSIAPGIRSRRPIGQMLRGVPENGARISLLILSDKTVYDDVPVVVGGHGR